MINVQNEGYTILEVMIVIAISASMFLFVSVTFSGRQQQVQFTQAVRDFDSRLNDIINDVSTGFFPQNNSKVCESTNGANSRPEFNNSTPLELGSNSECVNIGKVIQFSPRLNDGSNDNEQYLNVYNVAGLRRDNLGGRPQSLEESIPTADPDPQTILLDWGLKITRVVRSDAPTSDEYGGLGIFTSLNRGEQLQASNTNEDVRVNVIPNTGLNMSESEYITEIDSLNDKINNAEVNFNTRPEIYICVSDFDEERRAYLALGGNNIGNTLEFDNVEVCNP